MSTFHTSHYPVGASIRVISKTSKNRGKCGVIVAYCKGHYESICRVQLEGGAIINLFDMSVELC